MAMFNYKYEELFNPTLAALHNLGGSGNISEIEEEVANVMNLSDDEISDIHRGNRTKLSYRLAWARTYLKGYGLLENSSRGVWGLSAEGLKVRSVDESAVTKAVKNTAPKNNTNVSPEIHPNDKGEIESALEESDVWRDKLLEIILSISPDSFERLCQRLLRELGFVNVQVTGKSGDGGIDGKGVVKIGGVLSFHVVFQCKRYQGNVSSSTIRDFRGAMIGRADKGLVITTGRFTRDAKKEAQRDGAPPIDLIDGYELVNNLKNLRLGIDVEMVEKVNIRKEWFASL